MMGRTHAVAGVAALWVLWFLPADHLAILAPLAALGALLPDLDASRSLIRSLRLAGVTPFVPLAYLINRTLTHRGLLHSWLGWSLASLLVLPLGWKLGACIPLALSVGYLSHLALDACTKQGLPFLYPQRTRYHLMPRALRLTTNSHAEDVFLVALCVLVLLLFLKDMPAEAL